MAIRDDVVCLVSGSSFADGVVGAVYWQTDYKVVGLSTNRDYTVVEVGARGGLGFLRVRKVGQGALSCRDRYNHAPVLLWHSSPCYSVWMVLLNGPILSWKQSRDISGGSCLQRSVGFGFTFRSLSKSRGSRLRQGEAQSPPSSRLGLLLPIELAR